MIEEAETKLGLEQTRCMEFFEKQGDLIKGLRADIEHLNSVVNKARKDILAASAIIEELTPVGPDLENALAEHELKCADDIKLANDQLKIINADLEVMGKILEKTTCTSLLQCMADTGDSFIMFRKSALRTRS